MSLVTARTDYDKSASLKCDGKLFHSLGPAKSLSPKVLWVDVMTHDGCFVMIM